jgi:protein-disulfide isomerase
VRKEVVGNIMTGILCACALTITALVVRQQFFAPPPAAATTIPTTIKNWRDFQSGRTLTAPGGRVSLIVFSDYECPACRAFSTVVDSLRARYPNTLSVYYRHLPIPSHPNARPAALASECAAVQGRFPEAHRLLFSTPDSNGLRPWGAFAAQVGVRNLDAFSTCMRDSTQVALVQQDEAAAKRLNVRMTPTMLLDDELLEGGQSLADMDARIRKHLTR